MRGKYLYTILVLATLLGMTAGFFQIFMRQDTDGQCDLRCDNGRIAHTICDATPPCESYRRYDLTHKNHRKLKDLLITGHNGLRNRVAAKLDTAHMLYMKWDDELARMATNFQQRCRPYQPDRCTLFLHKVHQVLFVPKNYLTANYTQVVQNNFFMKVNAAPHDFVESALRQWFHEVFKMKSPTPRTIDNKNFNRLEGENNFTHIVYSFSYKFGCAYAKFKGGLSLTCNYFPYYRSHREFVYLRIKNLGNQCPLQFPFKHKTFKKLCYYADFSGAQPCFWQRGRAAGGVWRLLVVSVAMHMARCRCSRLF